MRREIGRPKKMRNKLNDEPRNPHVLPRSFTITTCQKCGALGHNMTSCKGKRGADRAITKGGNKTKKAKTINSKTKTKTTSKTKTSTKDKTKINTKDNTKKNTKDKTKTTNVTEIGCSSQGPPLTQPT